MQILRILTKATNADFSFKNKIQAIYDKAIEDLDLTFGTIQLGLSQSNGPVNDLNQFILQSDNIEGVLFAIESLFNGVSELFKENEKYIIGGAPKLVPQQAISELNKCLRQSNSGYSFEGGRIIRMESMYIHQEITKPAIQLLTNTKFEIALKTYLKAYNHWRLGNFEECLNDCSKAIESTIKVICTENNWTYDSQKDTASKLIAICFQNGLVPSYLQTQFNSLQSLLDSGVTTLRNKKTGHGLAPGQVPVTSEITKYGLHLTGSSIIFLIEQSGIK